MANNFHDNTGLFIVGVDGHVGLHFPPLMVPTFFVSVTAVHPFILGGDQQPTVLMNGGHPSVQDKHNPKFLWPHIAFFPDPLDMFTPLHCIFGEQQCWLPRLAVHICGKPAAPTAIAGPISVNLDCWEFAKLPTSLVVQVGTVQTTPSPEDYLYGAVRFAVETAIDVVIFLATGGFGKGTAFTKAGINRAFGEVSQQAVKQVMEEGLEHMGREGFDNITNAINKQLRDQAKDKLISKLLWDAPSGKLGWANRLRQIVQDGTGFSPGDSISSAVTGQDNKSEGGWDKALKSAVNKFIPVSGPIMTANDLREQQNKIAEEMAKQQKAQAGGP
ncbi:hypothetical protein [Polyangium aurulentum]|uniref:hypothetical protein n=1 Tax=Polyangium aurulentum TaxID=2567896 RepID=UPI0010ADB74E|nr:hypothetical protein [Polyangium aurulentum]UQA54603.1 hypothetical protein E8A73_024845 [Polyangium aurulentum]